MHLKKKKKLCKRHNLNHFLFPLEEKKKKKSKPLKLKWIWRTSVINFMFPICWKRLHSYHSTQDSLLLLLLFKIYFFRQYAWINHVWEDTSSYKELDNLGGEQHTQIKCFPEYKTIKGWWQPIKRSQAFQISDLLAHLSFLRTVLLIWFLKSIIFLLL